MEKSKIQILYECLYAKTVFSAYSKNFQIFPNKKNHEKKICGKFERKESMPSIKIFAKIIVFANKIIIILFNKM